MFVVHHGGYPFDVLVAVGVTDDQLLKRLASFVGDVESSDRELLKMTPMMAGRAARMKDGRTVIRLKRWNGSPEDYGHLAHEVFHAVDFLFRLLGIKLTPQTDEVYAYAIAHLSSEILKRLNKK
jgi:hypothetical protein